MHTLIMNIKSRILPTSNITKITAICLVIGVKFHVLFDIGFASEGFATAGDGADEDHVVGGCGGGAHAVH